MGGHIFVIKQKYGQIKWHTVKFQKNILKKNAIRELHHWVLGIKFVWQHCRAQVEELLEIRLWRARNRITLSKQKQQHHLILAGSSYTTVPPATCLFMDVCTARRNATEHHIAIPFHDSLWKVCDGQCTNFVSHCSTLTDQHAARARWISPNCFIVLLTHGKKHGTGGCDLLYLGKVALTFCLKQG